jgi:flagellar basal-body rod modification protein FlgD
MLNASQNSSAASSPALAINLPKNAQSAGAQAAKSQGTNALGASAAGTTDAKGGATKAKGGVEESQDRFLKLLVTQMKNQDPLNPMDNAQVTSQMAQLSTVSGIDKLNATLAALSSSMAASQSMQASSMIGRVVMAPGSRIELKNGKGMAGLELAQPADSVTVQIKDVAGNVVRSMNMGSQAGGVVPVLWDGMNDAGSELEDGSYQFSAAATLGGKNTNADTLSYGLVNSVVRKPEGTKLNVEHLGETSMESVKQIL